MKKASLSQLLYESVMIYSLDGRYKDVENYIMDFHRMTKHEAHLFAVKHKHFIRTATFRMRLSVKDFINEYREAIK